ncbi:MAG: T9SS type A sorting domain-containing protein [Bacteroidales bacterium]|nr:T9SS type A sorting domain-containing protein [Bacteroidales bacterium]
MKKLILSLLVLLGFLFNANAQSLELYHEGELFEMGETVNVVDYPIAIELVAEMSVKNVSNETLTLYCRKIELDVMPGTSNTFCWGICFAPSVYLSPLTIVLSPGQTTNEFSGHYMPGGIEGMTKMCYSFFPQSNPGDSTYFYVDFLATQSVGIDEPKTDKVFVSNPYPNPANSQVTFDYSFPSGYHNATINIHNLLGAKVKEVNIFGNNGKAVVDVNDLNDGIYFYSVNLDNEILETKRLVVSR